MPLSHDGLARQRLEDLIERFEQDWQDHRRPAIERYLTEAPDDRTHLLRELVHTDLEYRVRAGEASLVEEYLHRFPELADDADTVIELVRAEYHHRQRCGQCVTPAEYRERFPQYDAQQLPSGADEETKVDPLPGGLHRQVRLPKAIGRYRVEQVLGRGGMGEVVRVLDDQFDRPLALKILRPEHATDADLVARFQREARLTGRLQHPGIPPVQERGQLDDGRPYFIMKLVKGRDLEELLGERPSPADRQTHYLGVFEQICRTVAYAHASGVLHRDLKPANVMVGAFGEVQVMDWGLAKVLTDPAPPEQTTPRCSGSSTVHHLRTPGMQGGASVAGTILGTPAYMAPEQARGEVEKLDAGCDVFGLGGILAQILTGQPPFADGSDLDNLRSAMKGDLAPAFARLDGCGADADLIALAKLCLAPERADRPADAGAVAQAVAAYQDQVRERLRQAEVARARAEVKAVEERKRRRLSLALAASVLVLLAAAGAGGWWALEQRAEQDRQDLLRVEEKKREEERARLAVEGSLRQAKEMQAKAQFAQARKTLLHAQQLLGPHGSQGLHKQVKMALDNLVFVEILDRIRQGKSLPVDGKIQYASAAPAYAAALKKQGLDVVHGDLRALVKWVVDSPAREEVVGALDDWLCLEPETLVRSRLCQLTAKVTGQAWREELPAKWDDRMGLEELLATVPPQEMTVALLVGLGTQIRALGGDGMASLQRARLRYPGDFWVWFELGTVYANYGKEYARHAADAILGALAIRPESVVAWYNLGVALGDSGDLPGAIAAYKEAIRLDPSFSPAHFNLAIDLHTSGDLPGAIAAHKESVRLSPKSAPAHRNLGYALYASGDLPGTIAAYKEAVRLDPKHPYAHFSLGAALADSGDLPGAIAAYKEALRLDPEYTEVHVYLGKALRLQREYAESFKSFQAAYAFDKLKGHVFDMRFGNPVLLEIVGLVVGMAAAEVGKVSPEQKAAFRQQALEWLQADLAVWNELVRDDAVWAKRVRRALKAWQAVQELASVRDEQALAQLPQAEGTAWRQFWAEVDALVQRAERILARHRLAE